MSSARMEVDRIYTMLRRAYEGPAWHGPAVSEVLAGVSAEQAQRRQGEAHTIIEIVRHITAWKYIVIRRVLGEPAREIPADQDWPSGYAAASKPPWEAALADLARAQDEIQELLGSVSDERLNDPLANTPWTIYDLLHGVVQHDLYHAGQIALLKKLP